MKKFLISTAKSLGYFIVWVMLVGLVPIPDSKNPAIWRFWAELIPFFCIVGASLLFWLVEKKRIHIFPGSMPIKSCFLGTVCGILWLGLTFLIMSFLGVIKIENAAPVSLLWLWLFSALINTIMQELLVRGYLYQMIKTNYNIAAATIISSALFTLLHGGAFEAGIVPVLNVLSMSLLMTVVLEYTQSLIAPIVMHFLWNGIGAIILGGVSLAEDYPHVFTAVFSGNTLLSGGIYKMEGSVVVTLLNIILIAVFLLLIKRKKTA